MRSAVQFVLPFILYCIFYLFHFIFYILYFTLFFFSSAYYTARNFLPYFTQLIRFHSFVHILFKQVWEITSSPYRKNCSDELKNREINKNQTNNLNQNQNYSRDEDINKNNNKDLDGNHNHLRNNNKNKNKNKNKNNIMNRSGRLYPKATDLLGFCIAHYTYPLGTMEFIMFIIFLIFRRIFST